VTPTGEYRPSLLPLYNTYESTANLPVYLGQLEPIRAWLRGLVLDVACNFGRLSGLSPTTVSLDAERTFLLRGIELEKIRRPVRGSVASMPFRTGSFDTVLAIGVIEHVPRRHASTFLDELTRVTSSHGRLIICVMPKISLFSWCHLGSWDEDHHPYSPLRLRSELRKREWRAVATFSSGLLGTRRALPDTVNSYVPWAALVSHVFLRWNEDKNEGHLGSDPEAGESDPLRV
jgi:SAM-dependent methyltransferase